MIWQFLSYAVPWWVWLIPSALLVGGAAYLVWRFFGLRNALFLTVIGAFGVWAKVRSTKDKQDGWNERIEKENADAKDMVERANSAVRDVLAAGSDRLHDDDGFKRKK